MGGKRPDQYRIDPGETGATDYKFRRQDQSIKEQQRQQFKAGEAEKSFVPPKGENPERGRARRKRLRRTGEDRE